MDSVPIPANAIGFPGMVAMLQRTSEGAHDGALVVLRKPAGFVSQLLGAPVRVFAWAAVVLGHPFTIRGKPAREIIVADQCLRPVSQITRNAVERLVRHQAHQDFDAAVADLKRILNAKGMQAILSKAFCQPPTDHMDVEQALQVVPVATALGELGFWQENEPRGNVLVWAGVHAGTELAVFAGTNWFGQWQLTARCNTHRHALWDEILMPPEAPRGAIMLSILEFWRAAFGREAHTPDAFQLGLHYERHKAIMLTLDFDLPHVDLDGEILRSTRKSMVKRHALGSCDSGPLPDAPLTLSIDNGLMRMEACGASYGCSVRCGWIDPCQVSLREFLALPAWALRGHEVPSIF